MNTVSAPSTAACLKGSEKSCNEDMDRAFCPSAVPRLRGPVNSFFLRTSPQKTLPLTSQCPNNLVSVPLPSILSSQPLPGTSPHSLSVSLYAITSALLRMLPKLIKRGQVESRSR